MKIFLRNIIKIIPNLAMILSLLSVTTPCHFFTFQPDVPVELKKYEL